MERMTISNDKKQLEVKDTSLDDSRFLHSSMERIYFEDVNLTGMKMTDANLSDLEIQNAQMGGAYIHNIGMPPKGHPMHDPNATMRPVRFENCNLTGSTITNSNLSGVELKDCTLTGMKINGIPVEALLKAYELQGKK